MPIANGRKVVTSAGTAVRLDRVVRLPRSVVICAESDNTGIIVVGDASVIAELATRNAAYLGAGDVMTLDLGGTGDLADIYIDATVSGDGVTYTATAT